MVSFVHGVVTVILLTKNVRKFSGKGSEKISVLFNFLCGKERERGGSQWGYLGNFVTTLTCSITLLVINFMMQKYQYTTNTLKL